MTLATRRTTCDQYNPSLVDWQTAPLHRLKAEALQQYAAQIRSLARITYRKSGLPSSRAVCDCDAHYEVYHVKPINEFLPSDFVAEVNKLGNLVALCPNHRWEFDRGILSAEVVKGAAAIRAALSAATQNKRLLSKRKQPLVKG